MFNREHREQVAVIDWARLMSPRHPALIWLHAIPNGGKRHPKIARELKAEGVKAGISDLFLPCPKGRYSGLYIEMKIRPNKPSEKQIEFMKYASGVGYACSVCYSSLEAIDHLKKYLALPNKKVSR